MEKAQLTTFAARDDSGEGQYVAAMYFPGSQLLVVLARYSVPILLEQKLAEVLAKGYEILAKGGSSIEAVA